MGKFLGIQTLTLIFQSEPNLLPPNWSGQWKQFLESLSGMVSDIEETDRGTAILLTYQATAVAIYGIDPESCKVYMPRHFQRLGDFSKSAKLHRRDNLKFLDYWPSGHKTTVCST